MRKFLLGWLVGVLCTLIILVVFAGVQNISSERQLIERWRQLHPGLDRSIVIERLGTPLYDFAPREGFPGWARDSVPSEYSTSHGLLVFITSDTGSQLLLVYIDADNQVSFVSSVPT